MAQQSIFEKLRARHRAGAAQQTAVPAPNGNAATPAPQIMGAPQGIGRRMMAPGGMGDTAGGDVRQTAIGTSPDDSRSALDRRQFNGTDPSVPTMTQLPPQQPTMGQAMMGGSVNGSVMPLPAPAMPMQQQAAATPAPSPMTMLPTPEPTPAPTPPATPATPLKKVTYADGTVHEFHPPPDPTAGTTLTTGQAMTDTKPQPPVDTPPGTVIGGGRAAPPRPIGFDTPPGASPGGPAPPAVPATPVPLTGTGSGSASPGGPNPGAVSNTGTPGTLGGGRGAAGTPGGPEAGSTGAPPVIPETTAQADARLHDQLNSDDERIREGAKLQIDQRQHEMEASAASFLAARGISNSGAAVRAYAKIAGESMAAWGNVEKGIAETHQQHGFEMDMQTAQHAYLTNSQLTQNQQQLLLQNNDYKNQMQQRADEYTKQYGVNPKTGVAYTALEAAMMTNQANHDMATADRLGSIKTGPDGKPILGPDGQPLRNDDGVQAFQFAMTDKNFSHQSSLLAQEIFGQLDVQKSAQNFQKLMVYGPAAVMKDELQDKINAGTATAEDRTQFQNISDFDRLSNMDASKMSPADKARYDELKPLYDKSSMNPFDLNNRYAQLDFDRQLAGAMAEAWASSPSGGSTLSNLFSGVTSLDQLKKMIDSMTGGHGNGGAGGGGGGGTETPPKDGRTPIPDEPGWYIDPKTGEKGWYGQDGQWHHIGNGHH